MLPDVSSELRNVNETISETLHATKLNADESLIPVNRKTPGGEEILKEVSSFLEQKLVEKLPEPPATQTAAEKQTTVNELVALSTNCSQVIGRKATNETGKDSSQTLFSYKKSEIKEISLKVEKPSLEDTLLDYVRQTNGEIDITRCSTDLKTSHEAIEKALENLDTKGKIKIEVKTAE